jgi:uncharacterized iron-regulated membrane protein
MARPWHGLAMNQGSKASAGGIFIAIAIMAGFAFGLSQGQASAGVLAGLAIGVMLAIAVWLWDRRRPN